MKNIKMDLVKNRLSAFVMCLLSVFGTNLNIQAQSFSQYIEDIDKEDLKIEAEYDIAFKKKTLDALLAFKKRHSNNIYYKEKINNCITDFKLWDDAKRAHTIVSYNRYLAFTKFNLYKEDASEAIIDLQSIVEWNRIFMSTDKNVYNKYIHDYPKSSYLILARNRFLELDAVDYYHSNKYMEAYQSFLKAGGKEYIDSSNYYIYEIVKEYYEYRLLSDTSSIYSLNKFLVAYPNGKYSDTVSNMLALSKAKNLNIFSSQNDFEEVLGYSKDLKTQNEVNWYIQDCIRKQEVYNNDLRKYRKKQRKQRIYNNGGYVNWGLQFLDLGFNIVSSNRYYDVGYYNVGLGMRVGNFMAPVQLELGMKPGVVFWSNTYSYDEKLSYLKGEDKDRRFHIPLYASLKINLFTVYKSKIFISALAMYNPLRKEFIENDFFAGGGIGISLRHGEWLLYYKQGLNNKYDIADKFIGTSMSYYF